jgi:hypothetical protein
LRDHAAARVAGLGLELVPKRGPDQVGVGGDLRLTFEDGTVGDVSFAKHEWTGVFEPLRDPARFAEAQVEAGTIVWPKDGLDMAPEPLYEQARRRQVQHQR